MPQSIFFRFGLEDEILQVARIALWDAAQAFDPKRGSDFHHYAWAVIRNRIRTFILREARHSKRFQTILSAPISEYGNRVQYDVSGGYEAPFFNIIREEMRSLVAEYLGACTQRHRIVLEGIMARRTLEDIGKDLGGITKQSAHEIKNDALDTFKKFLSLHEISFDDILLQDIEEHGIYLQHIILSSQPTIIPSRPIPPSSKQKLETLEKNGEHRLVLLLRLVPPAPPTKEEKLSSFTKKEWQDFDDSWQLQHPLPSSRWRIFLHWLKKKY